jgi:hypothetical protein
MSSRGTTEALESSHVWRTALKLDRYMLSGSSSTPLSMHSSCMESTVEDVFSCLLTEVSSELIEHGSHGALRDTASGILAKVELLAEGS